MRVPGMDVNTFPSSNLYPKSSIASLGIGGSAASSFSDQPSVAIVGQGGMNQAAAVGGSTDAHTQRAIAVAGTGKPLPWWIALTVLLFGLMFLAKKLGTEKDFSNIKLSVYNVLIISLAAIVGMSFWKVLFTRIPVPGLSAIVLAA